MKSQAKREGIIKIFWDKKEHEKKRRKPLVNWRIKNQAGSENGTLRERTAKIIRTSFFMPWDMAT